MEIRSSDVRDNNYAKLAVHHVSRTVTSKRLFKSNRTRTKHATSSEKPLQPCTCFGLQQSEAGPKEKEKENCNDASGILATHHLSRVAGSKLLWCFRTSLGKTYGPREPVQT